MINLITTFFTIFLSKFLLWGSIVYFIYVLYIFFRCMNRREKLSESLTLREKQYFYFAITYLLTYIFL
jgi:hypothetical protein